MSSSIRKLIRRLEYRILQGTAETVVTEIVYDSRKAVPGSMFVCIKGYRMDGHDYIEEAVGRGAAAVVVQENVFFTEKESYVREDGRQSDQSVRLHHIPKQITVIAVPDTRIALAEMAAAFYRYPAKEMQIIGVTGTKGKTTTAYMIREGFRLAGHRTGLIGTIEVDADGAETEGIQTEVHTTPESLELQQYLRIMADAGCDTVVMEVSSQALKMHRVEGIRFAVAVFTNLGEDHIGPGEHANMQEYLACKRKLFLQTDLAVGNQDDEYLEKVWTQTDCRKIRYMISHGEELKQGEAQTITEKRLENEYIAEYQAEQIENITTPEGMGSCCIVKGNMSGRLTLSMPGQYNISNGLAAMAVLKEMDVPDAVIFTALRTVQVPGRMEQAAVLEPRKQMKKDTVFGQRKYKENSRIRILVDYAHNAMSLQNSLETLRSYHPGRIVVIFGCGGNRSRARRMSMGETAGKYADLVIVTTDNPRYEDPEAIMREIEMGLLNTDVYYTMIADRKEAIRHAIEHARAGDMILIAGKGHENYQEIRGIRYPMDDRELVRECTQMLL